jgi:hypothetical protein
LNDTPNLKYIDLSKFDTLKLKKHDDFFDTNSKDVTLRCNKSIFNLTIPNGWDVIDINE